MHVFAQESAWNFLDLITIIFGEYSKKFLKSSSFDNKK